MKKFLVVMLICMSSLILSACKRGPALYVLNWSEYMSDELIGQFEAEFGVKVILETADTNEIMYTKIKGRTTKFDIAIPSDYMVHKLFQENLLVPFDLALLPNYEASLFDDTLQGLREDYFEGNEGVSAPYFWGSLGIMYNTEKAGAKALVEANGWRVFFDGTLTAGYKVGMYNSSRDAIAAAELYLGYDLNTTSDTELTAVQNLLKAQNYNTWGTDNLKTMVSEGNLDIALVYSGDFFDILYATMEDNLDITYNMFVPDTNNIWFDAMVIPTTSQNPTLAHQFINFMLDPENAYLNATEIGYCPSLKSAYQAMLNDPDYTDIITEYPYYPGTITNGFLYRDLGPAIYQQFELILVNAKG
ncbi:MAG: ABC transporter substrate-binding protein [Bacilli bacterium]|nr:ABC transporter substrate-binding protein [Bacilli bacterium]